MIYDVVGGEMRCGKIEISACLKDTKTGILDDRITESPRDGHETILETRVIPRLDVSGQDLVGDVASVAQITAKILVECRRVGTDDRGVARIISGRVGALIDRRSVETGIKAPDDDPPSSGEVPCENESDRP